MSLAAMALLLAAKSNTAPAVLYVPGYARLNAAPESGDASDTQTPSMTEWSVAG